MNRLFIFTLIIFPLITSYSYGNSELDEILNRIDKVYRSKSSVSDLSMMIKTPHWERTLELKSWTKGMENTFITILSPHKEKGISTLKKKNVMWNYFPKVNKVIKVPPSMMMGSWMGSDFTNDDLVKENTLIQDYKSRIIKTQGNIVTIELIPLPTTVTVWGKIILMADKLKFIPVSEDYYDEKNKKMRSLLFDRVKRVDGQLIPMRMRLISLTKPGHETVIIYKKLNLNANVKDHVFSMSNLQTRR